MLIRVTYDPPRADLRPGVQKVAVGTVLELTDRRLGLSLVKSWVKGGHVERLTEDQARSVYAWEGSREQSTRIDIAGVEIDARLPLR